MDHRILPDLIVLLEVARAGSLTRAARRLHTVQSNLTARIRLLEQETGARLLVRHPRGVRPTPAGEAALALATRLEAVLADLRGTFGRTARVGPPRLRLGAIETVAATHLPQAVARHALAHPGTDVTVEVGSSAALLRQLQAGELDVAFVSRAPGLPGYRERIAFRDELAIVAPARVRSVGALLSSGTRPFEVLVQRLGCSYTERLLAFLTARSRRGHQLRQLGTLEGVLGFVEVGAGIAAMPSAFVRAAAGHRKLRLLPLPLPLARLDTWLVAPAARDASSAVNELVAGWEGPARA